MPGCKVFVCQVLVYLKLDIRTYILYYLATHYHIVGKVWQMYSFQAFGIKSFANYYIGQLQGY